MNKLIQESQDAVRNAFYNLQKAQREAIKANNNFAVLHIGGLILEAAELERKIARAEEASRP